MLDLLKYIWVFNGIIFGIIMLVAQLSTFMILLAYLVGGNLEDEQENKRNSL